MEKLQSILNYSVGSFTVGKIFEAVIVFVICYFLIRIIMKVLKRVLGKTSLDATLSKIITAVIKFILCFITAIIVIDTLGVSATSLVAAFSVVGLAASLAVQDSLSNLASGIMILVTKPFKIGDYDIVSRLLAGEFLNYKAAISGNSTGTVKVSVRNLINSIERTSLIITDRAKSPIRCIFDKDMIKISSVTVLGSANDRVPAEMTGEKLEMGFNNKFLLDALRVCDTDEVIIKLSSPVHPIIIVPTDGDSFLFLILPVRLKTE